LTGGFLSSRSLAALLALATVAAVGCDKSETERKQELTQREQDSVFAASRVPGAKAVDKALKTADSATARQAVLDSAERAP
jgi:4-aminobutyrate aminotransferase-like enzyme